jgi:hypothetical protein
MKTLDNFLADSTTRPAALIEDQEGLLEIIRREKTELVGKNPIPPRSLPPSTYLRLWWAVK